MYTYDERSELLKQWKDESNLTYENLASAADVPVPTVQRIIDGKTSNPTFANVAAIVIALGHSLDEYYGLSKENSRDVTMYSLLQSSYEQRLHEKDIILELRLKEKDAIIDAKNRSVKYLRSLVMVLGSSLAVFFLICAAVAFVMLYQA